MIRSARILEQHDIGWSEPAPGGDITYVAITTSFVYVAVTLDAWSRRVVGYAISRSIDARLAAAALKAAISAAIPRGAACIIPTVGRNTLQKPIALSYESTDRRFDGPPRQSRR